MSVHPANYVVWAEIPVSDLTASQAFYEALLQTRMNRCEMGGFDIVDFKPAKAATGVAGHLYVGTPAPRGTRHPAAQHVIDDVAHRRPVARSGKAAGAAPVGQHHLGRSTCQDTVQHLDCGGQAGGWGHALRSCRILPPSTTIQLPEM
mgnify:CR=1 FL=1